jgi:two-component system OmpR family response regulator
MSLLRRYKKIQDNIDTPTYSLVLDSNEEDVLLHGERIDLTPAEFVLIKLLIKNRNITVSKEQILYESQVLESSSDGSLAVILNRLRKKLGSEVNIKTVRGVGYRLLS